MKDVDRIRYDRVSVILLSIERTSSISSKQMLDNNSNSFSSNSDR